MSNQGKVDDVIKSASDAVRVVIHVEQAYDILDELASNPKLDTLADTLAKISRLVTKVINDLQDAKKEDKCKGEVDIESTIGKLQWWFKVQDELYNYIKGLKDEKEQRRELKRFAAYALSPDPNTIRIVNCMKR